MAISKYNYIVVFFKFHCSPYKSKVSSYLVQIYNTVNCVVVEMIHNPKLEAIIIISEQLFIFFCERRNSTLEHFVLCCSYLLSYNYNLCKKIFYDCTYNNYVAPPDPLPRQLIPSYNSSYLLISLTAVWKQTHVSRDNYSCRLLTVNKPHLHFHPTLVIMYHHIRRSYACK